jgi:hypothetical protein
MAIIHQEKCFERDESPWEGIGWAIMPMAWTGWGTLGGEFETIIYHGWLYLRVLYVDRTNQQLYVLQADNWRWPAWWLQLHLWRFLQWSDFVLWRWLKDGP